MEDTDKMKRKTEFSSDHKAKRKGDKIKDIFLVTDHRSVAGGGVQLLTLKDREGTIRAVRKNTRDMPFNMGSTVVVRGFKDFYNGQHQITIEEWRRVPASLLHMDDLFTEQERELADERIDQLREFIETNYESDEMREFALELVSQNETNLRYAPAAKSNHHAAIGGLLQHTLSMMLEALTISTHYREYYGGSLDTDVVLTGCLAHDVGKTIELGMEFDRTLAQKAHLYGHIELGVKLVERAAQTTGLSQRLLTHVEHCVISHHNKAEWGSPVKPRTPEAWVVHLVDILDSRLGAVHELSTEATGRWSSWNRMLGTKIFGEPLE